MTTPLETNTTAGLRYIDATWRLDGSYNFKQPTADAEARAVFFVDVEGDEPDLARARAVIERVRAAGMIPTVRFTFAFYALAANDALCACDARVGGDLRRLEDLRRLLDLRPPPGGEAGAHPLTPRPF